MRVVAVIGWLACWWVTAVAVCIPGAHSVLVLTSGYGITSFLWGGLGGWYEDAWKTILEHKDEAVAYANVALQDSKKNYGDIADILDQFKGNMENLVEHAREVKERFEKYEADPSALLERLNDAGSDAVDNLQKEFQKPLPDDMDERAKYRADMIASILNHMKGPYIAISMDIGIPEDEARDTWERFRRVLEDTLIIAGQIVDKHPVLVQAVVITVVFMMLPEAFILRTFLRLFGFGPFGPVKGSLAAWLQMRFWGGVVARGSWFAWMQRAGMMKGWWTPVTAILRAIAALFGL